MLPRATKRIDVLKFTLIVFITLYGMPESQRTIPRPYTSEHMCMIDGRLLIAKYASMPLVYQARFECRPQPNIPETN